MSGISKTKMQKERLKSAIDSGGSSVKKLIQKKPRKHEESGIQKACFRWFSYQFPEYKMLLFAIPNAGTGRSKVQGGILKGEGVVSGVADLFLSIPIFEVIEDWNKNGLYIEIKTEKGVQQPNQKEFQKAVEAQGYQYTICRSVDEFIKTVQDYL